MSSPPLIALCKPLGCRKHDEHRPSRFRKYHCFVYTLPFRNIPICHDNCLSINCIRQPPIASTRLFITLASSPLPALCFPFPCMSSPTSGVTSCFTPPQMGSLPWIPLASSCLLLGAIPPCFPALSFLLEFTSRLDYYHTEIATIIKLLPQLK